MNSEKPQVPAAPLPPITTKLTKNQKKKRRQRLARLEWLAASIGAKAAAAAGDGPLQDHEPLEKRPKLAAGSAQHASPSPRAVSSLEPSQRRPQLSLSSFGAAGPFSELAIDAAAAPGDAAMPDPVFRGDLTHLARAMAAEGAHPSAAAPRPVPLLSDVATESAASAEPAPRPDGASAEEVAQAAAAAWPAAVAAPPAPAPALDAVAPLGPNGMRVFIHGNYHRYYGYRLGQAFSEDPRLEALERQWFAGRRCMDVGCNEGLVTLGIAAKFGVRSMIGVDLDEHLIRRACAHLREERSAAVQRAAAARRGGVAAAERRASRAAVAALAQTWFVHGDFMEARAEAGSVDCLTALSVTKWVHLHRGDAGLRAFFGRVRTLLAPGGLFVLEPQPWRSYRAAADKMRRQGGAAAAAGLPLPPGSFFHRLGDLELRPEGFADVLAEEFGFELVRQLQPPEETARGFDRPVFLFRKRQ